MSVRRPCRGVGGPCPRKTGGSMGYCAICWRRVLEIRAIEEMLELAGLALDGGERHPADDDRDGTRAERHVDGDGTVWTLDGGEAAAE